MRREPQESSWLSAFGFVLAIGACCICFAMILPPIIPIAIGAVWIICRLFRGRPAPVQCDRCHLLYRKAEHRKCPKCGSYKVVI